MMASIDQTHQRIRIMKNLIQFVSRLSQDESGASAAEYALILAIIGAGIAAASLALGNSISGAMNTAGTCISNTATC